MSRAELRQAASAPTRPLLQVGPWVLELRRHGSNVRLRRLLVRKGVMTNEEVLEEVEPVRRELEEKRVR